MARSEVNREQEVTVEVVPVTVATARVAVVAAVMMMMVTMVTVVVMASAAAGDSGDVVGTVLRVWVAGTVRAGGYAYRYSDSTEAKGQTTGVVANYWRRWP